MNVISFTGDTPLIHAVHPGQQEIAFQIAGYAKIPDPNNPTGELNVPCQLVVAGPHDLNTPPARPIPVAPDVWGQPNTSYKLIRQDVTGAEAVLLDTLGDIQAHYNAGSYQDDYAGGGRDNDLGFAIESELQGSGAVIVRLHRAVRPGVQGDNNVMAALKATA